MEIVCYSGGESSALVAVEVARKFRDQNVVLLNHDINPNVEDSDIKRFKTEVAAYLGLPITYANCKSIQDPESLPDQFDVCVEARAFQVQPGQQLCTNRLKTQPFEQWLFKNAPKNSTIHYGFDANEKHRVIRRRKVLQVMGYQMSAPLAEWKLRDRTIRSTTEIGVSPPGTYSVFTHANCIGCLKAKKQHWYIVFCTRPDVWDKAKASEAIIGHSILPQGFLADFESVFATMQAAGVAATERTKSQRFWIEAKKAVQSHNNGQLSLLGENGMDQMPCECVF